MKPSIAPLRMVRSAASGLTFGQPPRAAAAGHEGLTFALAFDAPRAEPRADRPAPGLRLVARDGVRLGGTGCGD